MTPEEGEIIDHLILSGALEACGIDMENGEMLYNFTDKLQQVDPLLHDEFQRYFTSETMALWEHGFIEMDITLDQPLVSLTQKAFDSAEVLKLNKDHQYTLKEIIRIILDDSDK
jgi:hypothetical protein